jgi:hypothetical protein
MLLSRPRFRHDLVATPIDVDGIAYVDVTDPRSGESFRFYDFEYKVALAFGGLPFDRVVPWVRLSAGLELSEDQLREFAEELARRGFLEEQDGPTPPIESVVTPPLVSPYGTMVEGRVGPLPSPTPPPAPPQPIEPVIASPPVEKEPILFGPRQDDVPLTTGGIPDLASWFPVPPPIEDEMSSGALKTDGSQGDDVDLSTFISGPIPAPISKDIDLSELDLKQDKTPPPPLETASDETPPPEKPLVETPLLEAPSPPSTEIPPTETPSLAAPIQSSEEAQPTVTASSEEASTVVLSTPVPTEAAVILPAWLNPIQAPPAIVTPAPVSVDSILHPDHPPSLPARKPRRLVTLYAALGSVAGALVVVLLLLLFFSKDERALPKMQAIRAELETIYRFYPTPSLLGVTPGKVLTLPVAGKITRLPTVGSRIAPGEPALLTEKARPIEAQIALYRERLAYNTQLKDSAHQLGNSNEERIQNVKIAQKNAQIAKAQQALTALVPVPEYGGEVEEVYVNEGDMVARGAVVIRLRSSGLSARFDLTRPEVARARRNQNCYFWMDRKVRECMIKNDVGGDSFVIAEIPADKSSGQLLGKSVQLVRTVFHNAARIPPRAVVHGETSDRVWLVSPRGRVEPRSITVGEITDEEAIIVQGLDSGDIVVSEPHPALSAGSLIAVDTPQPFPAKTP